MNIVLCGMPGSGKTTVGRALAALLGKKFVDTDEAIEREHGPIARIFSEHGEEYFRTLESGLARELAALDGLVIATGGGFLLRPENRAALCAGARVVFLRASEDTLVKRLRGDGSRPLLRGDLGARLGELAAARTPVYEAACDLAVDTDGREPIRIAETIAEELK